MWFCNNIDFKVNIIFIYIQFIYFYSIFIFSAEKWENTAVFIQFWNIVCGMPYALAYFIYRDDSFGNNTNRIDLLNNLKTLFKPKRPKSVHNFKLNPLLNIRKLMSVRETKNWQIHKLSSISLYCTDESSLERDKMLCEKL